MQIKAEVVQFKIEAERMCTAQFNVVCDGKAFTTKVNERFTIIGRSADGKNLIVTPAENSIYNVSASKEPVFEVNLISFMGNTQDATTEKTLSA